MRVPNVSPRLWMALLTIDLSTSPCMTILKATSERCVKNGSSRNEYRDLRASLERDRQKGSVCPNRSRHHTHCQGCTKTQGIAPAQGRSLEEASATGMVWRSGD